VDGAPCSNSNTNSTPEQRNRSKRDPATPDTNEDNSSGCQKQKKPRRGVKVDTAAKERKELGMFYFGNASVNPSDIFPRDMPEKVCANFTCKGKECKNANCNFAQPRKASKLKHKTILLIASHFIKKMWIGSTNIISCGCLLL
jgi:hypothetical protein